MGFGLSAEGEIPQIPKAPPVPDGSGAPGPEGTAAGRVGASAGAAEALPADIGEGKAGFEKGPVWIRVVMTPEQAKACTDTLHLSSDSGDYDRKEPISSFREETPGMVDVVFEDAPMDRFFSLEVIDQLGQAQSIFTQVPYEDLRKTRERC